MSRHRPGPGLCRVPRGRGAAGAWCKTQAGGSGPSLPARFCSRLLLKWARPGHHVSNCTQLSLLTRLRPLCLLLLTLAVDVIYKHPVSHVHPLSLFLLEREPHEARVFIFFSPAPQIPRGVPGTQHRVHVAVVTVVPSGSAQGGVAAPAGAVTTMPPASSSPCTHAAVLPRRGPHTGHGRVLSPRCCPSSRCPCAVRHGRVRAVQGLGACCGGTGGSRLGWHPPSGVKTRGFVP